MLKTSQFTIRINPELKIKAQKKANEELGIGLGTFTKLFLKYFVAKPADSKISFYIGDEDFDEHLKKILGSKKVNKALKDLANSI